MIIKMILSKNDIVTLKIAGSLFLAFLELRTEELILHHLLIFEPFHLLMLVDISSQLDLSVQVVTEFLYNQLSDALLQKRVASFAVESAYLL